MPGMALHVIVARPAHAWRGAGEAISGGPQLRTGTRIRLLIYVGIGAPTDAPIPTSRNPVRYSWVTLLEPIPFVHAAANWSSACCAVALPVMMDSVAAAI